MRTPWGVAAATLALVLLTACGGGSDGSSTSTTDLGANQSGQETGFSTPSPEASRTQAPKPKGGGGKKVITAGPTLDGGPTQFFDTEPVCVTVRFDQPLSDPATVSSVKVTAPWQGAKEDVCGEQGSQPACNGYTFPRENGLCFVGLQVAPGTTGSPSGALVVWFDTSCTSRTGPLCELLPGDSKPSPTAPVQAQVAGQLRLTSDLGLGPSDDSPTTDTTDSGSPSDGSGG